MIDGDEIVCDVSATMTYVVRGEKATFHAGEREKSYWPGEEHQVVFHDMRPEANELALERNGFVLLDEPTDVTEFTDPGEKARYAKQCEALVQRLTGAKKVVSFGPIVRTRYSSVTIMHSFTCCMSHFSFIFLGDCALVH